MRKLTTYSLRHKFLAFFYRGCKQSNLSSVGFRTAKVQRIFGLTKGKLRN